MTYMHKHNYDQILDMNFNSVFEKSRMLLTQTEYMYTVGMYNLNAVWIRRLNPDGIITSKQSKNEIENP